MKIFKMERLINITLLFIGLALLLGGMHYKEIAGDWYDVLISVGGSFLSSSIVSWFVSYYIERYQKAKEISETWGIKSMEERRATINTRINALDEKARKQIDFIAFGLKSLREGNPQAIQECLRRGVAIRIITVDPNNNHLRERDCEENKVEGSTAETIRQLTEWGRQLDKDYPGKVEIRYSDYIPTEFYNRVDNSIFVGPYQHGRESQQMITTEYASPGKAFKYYADYFEELWNDERYCHE